MTNKEMFLRDALNAANQLEKLKDELLVTVSGARRHGASWAEIGGAVGMTKQAAQQRWGKLTPAPMKTTDELAAPTVHHWACDVCTWTIAYAPENLARGLDTIAEHVKTHTDEDYLRVNDAQEPATASIFSDTPAPAKATRPSKKVDAPAPATSDPIHAGITDTSGNPIDWTANRRFKNPSKCPFCEQKTHLSRRAGHWFIYPDCTLTANDYTAHDEGATK